MYTVQWDFTENIYLNMLVLTSKSVKKKMKKMAKKIEIFIIFFIFFVKKMQKFMMISSKFLSIYKVIIYLFLINCTDLFY